MYIKVDRQTKTKRNQKERREGRNRRKGRKERGMDRQMDPSNRASKLQLFLPEAGWSTC